MLARAVVLAAVVAVCAGDLTYKIISKKLFSFEILLAFTSPRDISGWRMRVTMPSRTKISLVRTWDGDWTRERKNTGYLQNMDSTGPMKAGETITNIMTVTCDGYCRFPFELQVVEPQEGGSISWDGVPASGLGPPIGAGQGTKDYADALKKSIMFYNTQRSGRLPDNNPISWRGDSFLDDCVPGGWFDNGEDFAKYGLPFGFATHALMWGLYQFKDGYERAGQLDEMYDMIKWATDYMLNAYDDSTKELVAQIGANDNHHSPGEWDRPEGVVMDRRCVKMSESRPAPELYGEWAAALAAGYLVWTDKGDTDYANEMLAEAVSMYAVGKASNRTEYNDIADVDYFYHSDGYEDELCLAAVWLYRATGDSQYLKDAKNYHPSGSFARYSWHSKQVACQLLLYEETNNELYRKEVTRYIERYSTGPVAKTPCGLAWLSIYKPNSLAAGAAWIALVAANAGIDADDSRKFAVEQINFLLGDNNRTADGCFSYQIGYGNKYPLHPHHRGISMCDGCTLYGALVGGPDVGGFHRDTQADHVMNGVSLLHNAAFQSALAAIVQLQKEDAVPGTQSLCTCPSQ